MKKCLFSTEDLNVVLDPWCLGLVAKELARLAVVIEAARLHLQLDIGKVAAVDVRVAALTDSSPAQYNALDSVSHYVVQVDGLELSRHVFGHLDAHHPVVLAQVVNRCAQIDVPDGAVGLLLDERCAVEGVVAGDLLQREHVFSVVARAVAEASQSLAGKVVAQRLGERVVGDVVAVRASARRCTPTARLACREVVLGQLTAQTTDFVARLMQGNGQIAYEVVLLGHLWSKQAGELGAHFQFRNNIQRCACNGYPFQHGRCTIFPSWKIHRLKTTKTNKINNTS